MTMKKVYDSGTYAGIRYNLSGELPASPIEPKYSNWYICKGFCGYNTPANNRGGYKTEKSAVSAIRRYQKVGEKHQLNII
jgi:hypothetical protein